MKKRISIMFVKQICLVLFASVPFFAVSGFEGASVMEFEGTPPSVQLFVNQHFPNRHVASVRVEYLFFKRKIKVMMDDGTEIDFDDDGDWIDIENAPDDVILNVIPCAVVACVHDHYHHAHIVGAERCGNKFKLKLSDRTVLTFNEDYDLL
ncbi:MAG: PepSY-like domain-containing protein [Bacteroidaceae bacterium]|nr:PepSY-like domain-containing protein [Bacteroidaceae bacterium]